MTVKTTFLLLCVLIAVNCYNVQRTEDGSWPDYGSSHMEGDQSLKSKRSGDHFHDVNHRDQETRNNYHGELHAEKYEGLREEETLRGKRGQGSYGLNSQQTPAAGQKVKLNYVQSSSSSSQENSDESHEIRQVEKQYHDTDPQSNGNSRIVSTHIQPGNPKIMNFEHSELREDAQNAIDKEM